MISKTFLPEIPYRLFLMELDEILNRSGIISSRLPVMAGAESEKNRFHPASQENGTEIGSVIIFIEEHLGEELSLEKLAGEVQLSKYQLIRRFQDEQGTTPWKFIIGKRVERAKELLEKGMSPGQTAAESGFYDQSHMNKVFREETGLTPKEYQEENFRNRN